jgi:hypothetical protein
MNNRLNFITDPNLVLYLPLYQVDGASLMSRDACGYLGNATGAQWKPDGRTFDGIDDYIALPDNLLAGASRWTINLWLKANDITTNNLSPIGGSLGEWNAIPHLRHVNSKYQISILHSSEFIVQNKSVSGDVLLNQWENVCFLYDGFNCLFYRNGVLTDTLNALNGKSLDTSTVNSRLGGGHNTSSKAYSGTIGEVIIFDRTLTPQEIQHIHHVTTWRYL